MADGKTYIYATCRGRKLLGRMCRNKTYCNISGVNMSYTTQEQLRTIKLEKKELKNYNELEFIIFYMTGINYSETLCWKP